MSIRRDEVQTAVYTVVRHGFPVDSGFCIKIFFIFVLDEVCDGLPAERKQEQLLQYTNADYGQPPFFTDVDIFEKSFCYHKHCLNYDNRYPFLTQSPKPANYSVAGAKIHKHRSLSFIKKSHRLSVSKSKLL